MYSKYNKEPLQLPASLNYYDLWMEQLKKHDYIESTYLTIIFSNKNKLSYERDYDYK